MRSGAQAGPSYSADTDTRRRRLQLAELEAEIAEECPRSLSRIIDDGIFSFEFAERHKSKRRMGALYSVISYLPGPDYRKLCSLAQEKYFYFHMPEKNVHGSAKDMPAANVVYLFFAPHLESLSHEFCRHVVAHELAHVVLEHLMSSADRDQMEREADELAAKWGYPMPVSY